jgi:hypothetical protein
MKQALDLLDQIIDAAIYKDKAWKSLALQQHKAAQSLGDDTLIFHLRQLKELLEAKSDNQLSSLYDSQKTYNPPVISAQNKTFICCSG